MQDEDDDENCFFFHVPLKRVYNIISDDVENSVFNEGTSDGHGGGGIEIKKNLVLGNRRRRRRGYRVRRRDNNTTIYIILYTAYTCLPGYTDLIGWRATEVDPMSLVG